LEVHTLTRMMFDACEYHSAHTLACFFDSRAYTPTPD
jgi:hypothetical protein